MPLGDNENESFLEDEQKMVGPTLLSQSYRTLFACLLKTEPITGTMSFISISPENGHVP